MTEPERWAEKSSENFRDVVMDRLDTFLVESGGRKLTDREGNIIAPHIVQALYEGLVEKYENEFALDN